MHKSSHHPKAGLILRVVYFIRDTSELNEIREPFERGREENRIHIILSLPVYQARLTLAFGFYWCVSLSFWVCGWV